PLTNIYALFPYTTLFRSPVRIRCDAREMLPPHFSGNVQYAAPIGYSRCTCRRQTESGLRLDRTSGGGAADRGLNLSSLQDPSVSSHCRRSQDTAGWFGQGSDSREWARRWTGSRQLLPTT